MQLEPLLNLIESVGECCMYVDNCAAEVLKWNVSGGINTLYENGILWVQSLDSEQDPGLGDEYRLELPEPDPAKVVFLTTKKVHDVVGKIENILSSRRFKYCSIFTAVPEIYHQGGGHEGKVFSSLSRKLCAQLKKLPGDVKKIEIRHWFFGCAFLTPQLFMIPFEGDELPLVYGASKSIRGGAFSSEVCEDSLSKVASSLASLLLSIKRSGYFFCLGDHSVRIARKAVGLCSPSQFSESVAVLVIDRALDLATPCCHSNHLLDHVYNRGAGRREWGMDLYAPAEPVVSSLEYFVDGGDALQLPPISLAHGSDGETMQMLEDIIKCNQRDGLVLLRRKLVELIGVYGVNVKVPRVLGKVTMAQMAKFLGSLIASAEAIAEHGPLLELIAVILNCMRDVSKDEEEIGSSEESFQRYAGTELNYERVFVHIVDVFKKVWRKHNVEFSAIALLLYIFSYFGEAFELSEEHANHLESIFCESLEKSPEEAKNLVSLLRQISVARADLFVYASLNRDRKYMPLVAQVIADLFGREYGGSLPRDIQVVSQQPSSSIEAYFGSFGRLLKSSGHPRNFDSLIVLVVGGITFQEVKLIKEITDPHEDTKVYIGSTGIATRGSVLAPLLV